MRDDHYAMPDDDLVAHHLREQRAADGQGRTPGNFSGGPSPEQGPLVPIATTDPEVRGAIEELRGWIQECSDGVSNLGTRVARLEDGGCNASKVGDDVLRHQIAEVRARAEKDRTWTRDLIATWRKELGHKINRLEADADKCARFRAIHPPVTEEGNRD